MNEQHEPTMRHIHPKENRDAHDISNFPKWVLEHNGEEVAFAKVWYKSKPFPFFYIGYFHVKDRMQGQRYASKLLDRINDAIKKRGAIGIVKDTLDDGINHPSVAGMYERHGWVRMPEGAKSGEAWLTFNRKHIMSDDVIERIIDESQTEHLRRIKAIKTI